MISSPIAVSVRGLSKAYTIAHQGERPVTLAESLIARARRPFARTPTETFWALKDVSFDIAKGDVVGIIGRNGAGKSTLLKVLSRITEPTAGTVDLYGRVGSLLEVGTGFHPELSGRENVFLNGAILGMTKAEIRRQFDAIVDFAGVEQFLDTPVKRYSSGMYVRLAFAVAAHLNPEILIVDEVLAVGDAEFQKKCLGKMRDVAAGGRTVLFVSHQMQAVGRLCETCILMHAGKVAQIGPTAQVLAAHLRVTAGSEPGREWVTPDAISADGIVQLNAIRLTGPLGVAGATVQIGQPVVAEIEYTVKRTGFRLSPHIQINTADGEVVFAAIDTSGQWNRQPRPAGQYRTRAIIPPNFLAEGSVYMTAAVSSLDPFSVHAVETDSVMITVVDPTDGTGARGDYVGVLPGVVRPMLKWTTDQA